MLNFFEFIQGYVFTTNHHLKVRIYFPKTKFLLIRVGAENREK